MGQDRVFFRSKMPLSPPKSSPICLRVGSAEAGRIVLAGGWPWPCGSSTSDDPFFSPNALEFIQEAKHGFIWLSDLLVLSERGGAGRAAGLTETWLERYASPNPDSQTLAYQPEILSSRLHQWVHAWPKLYESVPQHLQQRIIQEIRNSLDFMVRPAFRKAVTPGRSVEYYAHFMMASLAMGLFNAWEDGSEWLMEIIDQEFYADGLHASRNPSIHYNNLKALSELSLSAHRVQVELHPALTYSLRKMAIALSCLIHRDGGLAIFQGSTEGNPFEIARVLQASSVQSIACQDLPQGGYQRLDAVDISVLVDTSSIPVPPFDRDGHASTGAIEVDIGRSRLFVNCGSPISTNSEWALALRQTAAHSTITIDDRSIASLRHRTEPQELGPRVKRGISEMDGKDALVVIHDGYRHLGGPFVQRRIAPGDGSSLLYGEDQLTGNWAGPFALRFHLHPLVHASMGADESHVRIQRPEGDALRFTANQGRLRIEESIYFGRGGLPSPTQQIVVEGDMVGHDHEVRWVLAET